MKARRIGKKQQGGFTPDLNAQEQLSRPTLNVPQVRPLDQSRNIGLFLQSQRDNEAKKQRSFQRAVTDTTTTYNIYNREREFLSKRFENNLKILNESLSSDFLNLTNPDELRLYQEGVGVQQNMLMAGTNLLASGEGIQGARQKLNELIQSQSEYLKNPERIKYQQKNLIVKGFNEAMVEITNDKNSDINHSSMGRFRDKLDNFNKNPTDVNLNLLRKEYQNFLTNPKITSKQRSETLSEIKEVINNPLDYIDIIADDRGLLNISKRIQSDVENSGSPSVESIKDLIKSDADASSVFHSMAFSEGIEDVDAYIEDWIAQKIRNRAPSADLAEDLVTRQAASAAAVGEVEARGRVNTALQDQRQEDELEKERLVQQRPSRSSSSAATTNALTSELANSGISITATEANVLEDLTSGEVKRSVDRIKAIDPNLSEEDALKAKNDIIKTIPSVTVENYDIFKDIADRPPVAPPLSPSSTVPLSFGSSGIDHSIIRSNEGAPTERGSSLKSEKTGIFSVREEFKLDKKGNKTSVSKGKSFGQNQLFGSTWNNFVKEINSSQNLGLSKEDLSKLDATKSSNEDVILNFIESVSNNVGEDGFIALEEKYLFDNVYKKEIDYAEGKLGSLSPEVRTFIADSANQHGGVRKNVIDAGIKILNDNDQLDDNSQLDILQALRQARVDYVANGAGGSLTEQESDSIINNRIDPTANRLIRNIGVRVSPQISETAKPQGVISDNNPFSFSNVSENPTQESDDSFENEPVEIMEEELSEVQNLEAQIAELEARRENFGLDKSSEQKSIEKKLANLNNRNQRRETVKKNIAEKELESTNKRLKAIQDAYDTISPINPGESTIIKRLLGAPMEVIRGKTNPNQYLIRTRDFENREVLEEFNSFEELSEYIEANI